MATLVTGAGLLGTSFATRARERGEKVVFFDPEPRADFLRLKLGEGGYSLVRGDIRNLPSLLEAIQTHQIRTIVHTAGLIGGRVQRELSLAFDINIQGTRNVAEAMHLAGLRRLVHVSTFGTYDWRRQINGPIAETAPLGPGRPYGSFKAAKEMILEAYAGLYKFELVMLRPANVFGLGHFWAGSSGGAKMQALMEAGISDRVARIASAETMDNEYVYAKDVGAALDLAATCAAPKDRAFNIGAGAVTRFDDLIAAMRRVFPKLQYEIEPGEPPKSKSFPLDISRAERQLGWTPQFTLETALADYRRDLEAARKSGWLEG